MILATLLLLAQDVNPQYEHWASFKPESWVKAKMVMKTPQMEMESEAVTKLLEVTDEKVVVETTTVTKFGGREMKLPARKQEFTKKPDPAKGATNKVIGEEEITVGGKKLKCTVYDWEMEAGPGEKAKGKAWVSKEIPGGMAKGEFKSERVPEPMKIEAVEWEKK